MRVFGPPSIGNKNRSNIYAPIWGRQVDPDTLRHPTPLSVRTTLEEDLHKTDHVFNPMVRWRSIVADASVPGQYSA